MVVLLITTVGLGLAWSQAPGEEEPELPSRRPAAPKAVRAVISVPDE